MHHIQRQLELAPHYFNFKREFSPDCQDQSDDTITNMKDKVKRLKSLQLELNKPPGIPAKIAKSPRKPKKAEYISQYKQNSLFLYITHIWTT